jgi:HAD superfamily hydrolase (TIGR01484 family)
MFAELHRNGSAVVGVWNWRHATISSLIHSVCSSRKPSGRFASARVVDMSSAASGAWVAIVETSEQQRRRAKQFARRQESRMRYFTLACDYDGTLAHHGQLEASTVAALERLRASGRKLLMVTGRELDDLLRVCPCAHQFDRIVAENGGVLYDPSTRDVHRLGPAPVPEFVRELERRNISPLSAGRVIVATWEPHGAAVFEVIRGMGLELQIIFNKGAVMVLPPGVNKATGLRRALDALQLSFHNTVGVGDAENDHAFLAACECGAAVANALDSLKAQVDMVTAVDHGDGVRELIDRIIATDLEELNPRLSRHDLSLGTASETGEEIRLPAHGGVLLVAGASGGGKSTVTTALLEALCEAQYQFCVLDPEGDYVDFSDAIEVRGSGKPRALIDDSLRVLGRPTENVIVNLLDERLEDRPHVLQMLLPRLLELRSTTGRPHWIVIDEAHHVLPSGWQPSETQIPPQLENLVLVTVHPNRVSQAILARVDTLIVVGRDPQVTADAFTRTRGLEPIRLAEDADQDDAALAWYVRVGDRPIRFQVSKPTADRRRHQRKYAEGELGEDKSFYFRGPEGRLNLRAQNLQLFSQVGDGVDDDTWLYHLRRHDISQWFREAIKDDSLADEAAETESQGDLTAKESRERIRRAIARRYTAPA